MKRLSVMVLALGSVALAQVVAPPAPRVYDVTLRYRIAAARNERLVQYAELLKFLESVGFDKEPGPDSEPEDSTETRMTGRIASAHARALLRDRHVKSVLLVPTGYTIPKEPNQLVKVQLELAARFTRNRQRLLAEQTLEKLRALGFRNLVGYDHREHTRLLGWIPAGHVETLLLDLRREPSGWFLPDERVSELPEPLRQVSPIEVIEVLPEPEGMPPARDLPPVEGLSAELQKVAPDLRRLALGEGGKGVVRMEVILNYVPTENDKRWRVPLERIGVVMEGRMGPIITLRTSAQRALDIAEVPVVSVVRLPRSAQGLVRIPLEEANGFDVLKATGLEVWQRNGRTGRGQRVGVIDGDFRGYALHVGKGLPVATRYVDLTAERNKDLKPDEFSSVVGTLGTGTQCALALCKAAPDVELTLIRVDPSCPYMVMEVARILQGEFVASESIRQRDDQMADAKDTLQRRWAQLLQERSEVFDDFSDTPEAQARRDAVLKKQAQLEADEEAHRRLLIRFQELKAEVQGLQGISIAASALVWNDGYPVNGGSGLTRWLDDRPLDKTLWFQAAGNSRGQAWTGLYRDDDDNGVMEFAPADLVRPERWTSELNFLAWEAHGKEATPNLPEKARIRVSIQWLEPHDPSFWDAGEDAYRQPLAKFRPMILRQRDPTGKLLATDDLEVVAVGTELPQRLENRPTYAIYEQSVEFLVDPRGRYALRMEGFVPRGIRPVTAPTLPDFETTWECIPRIFVDAVDPDSRLLGRPIWSDYFTDTGTVGMPADSRELIVVGAANDQGKARSFGSSGAPMNMRLSYRPSLILYDQLGIDQGDGANVYGSGLAAPFAAGQAALLLDQRTTLRFLRKSLGSEQGQLYRLRVP